MVGLAGPAPGSMPGRHSPLAVVHGPVVLSGSRARGREGPVQRHGRLAVACQVYIIFYHGETFLS